MEALPLTTNRKLNRRALPEPNRNAEPPAMAATAARNPVEKELLSIWRETLDVDEVGIYDNFFDLGGHSLIATQLLFRIRARLHVEIPLSSFFEAPTVAGLAEVAGCRQARAEDPGWARGRSSSRDPIGARAKVPALPVDRCSASLPDRS